jgi:hypothetical protein
MDKLGELERVPLDHLWEHEEQEFTPWLADNISYLNEVLQMELVVKGIEENVGGYFADIHARVGIDEEERDVIIENQYGTTDHSHLGKSIVYGSGFDADIIIWLAESFRDEHIDAIQWMNERTDDQTGFFGVRVELVQIDESPFAPEFTVVERPSRWKALTGGLSETHRNHYQFWRAFKERLVERDLEQYAKEPGSNASYGVPDNVEGATIRLASSADEKRIECALRIPDPDANLGGLDEESVRKALRSTISEIDTYEIDPSIVETAEFLRREDMENDKITLYYPDDVDRNNTEEWNTYHDWLIDAIRVFDDVFSTRF